MSQVITFAKSKSDATVKRTAGEEALEEHKKERLADKSEFCLASRMVSADNQSASEETILSAAKHWKSSKQAVSYAYFPEWIPLIPQTIPQHHLRHPLRRLVSLCLTNTSHPTIFSSSRICQRERRQTISARCLSCTYPSFSLHVGQYADNAGIMDWSRSVPSLRRKISRLSNTRTKLRRL